MATMRVRDCDLDYDVTGAGHAPPLVWGHGLTSSRGIAAAYPLIDLEPAEPTRAVVRYDARGHGLSSRLDDPTKGSWAELALDQIALIDALGLDRVVLGGVSMGAGTALHSVLALGDRVDQMVLVIPPTGWETRTAQVEMYEQTARVVDAKGPKALIATAAMLPPPDPFRDVSDWVDRRAGSLGGAIPDQLAACFRGAAHADLPPIEQLSTISTPTLVLAWSGDAGHPVSTAEQLGDALENVTVSIASTLDDFQTWSDQLHAFLDDSAQ